MMFQILGFLLLAISIAAFIFYLHTSYVTQGGSLGQDPCVAAATIQVPLLTMTGLALLHEATGAVDFLWWQWLLLWLGETVFIATAATWIGKFAHSKSGSAPP